MVHRATRDEPPNDPFVASAGSITLDLSYVRWFDTSGDAKGAMGKRKQPARPMQGFSKVVFGDDGAAAAVACGRCGAMRCFCKQDLQPAVVAQTVVTKRKDNAETSSETQKKARKVEPSAEQAAPQKAAARKAERNTQLRAAHRAAFEAAPRLCPATFREWKAGLSKAQRKAARKAVKKPRGEPTSVRQERAPERVAEETTKPGGSDDDDDEEEPEQEEEEEDPDDDEARVGAMMEAALRARRGGVVPLRSEAEWRAALRLSSELAVVVDFGAEWCGPCQAVAPLFARLCAEHAERRSKGDAHQSGGGDALFVHVDVDELEEAATEAAVTAMPTFAVYRAGACVDRVEGGLGSALEDLVRRTLVG